MRKITDFIDKHGCVVMGNGDGGDPNHGFFFVIGEMYAQKNDSAKAGVRDFARAMLNFLKDGPGQYVRHQCDGEAWHADPKEFSRDQTLPLAFMLSVCGFRTDLKELYWAHFRRLGKCQNKDWLFPEHWNIFIRGLGWWWLYPLLIIGDIQMIGSAIVRCIKSQRDFDDVGDDKNMTLSIMAGELYLWTPFVEIARLIYKYFRADWFVDGPYHHKISIGHGVQYAWDRYYREETGAPPINEYMRPFIKGWLV